jgi:hypothetical protein
MIHQVVHHHPLVIVRGWGDEPVRLVLYIIGKNTCYVGSETSKRPIGIPSNQVFAFNEELFSLLQSAYDSHRWTELSTLYERARLDDFSCNKYRNNVLSSHDQEDIPDTECATVSDSQ